MPIHAFLQSLADNAEKIQLKEATVFVGKPVSIEKPPDYDVIVVDLDVTLTTVELIAYTIELLKKLSESTGMVISVPLKRNLTNFFKRNAKKQGVYSVEIKPDYDKATNTYCLNCQVFLASLSQEDASKEVTLDSLDIKTRPWRAHNVFSARGAALRALFPLYFSTSCL